MQCPSCQNTDSRVLESRAADGGKTVRRRRECLNCEFRFTTYERVETAPITVLKRNGSREIFNPSKLLNGLNRASQKTNLGQAKIEMMVNEIESNLQQRNLKEVTSLEIGEMVLKHLKKVNEVAYVRFASVYSQFHGVDDFVKTLESMNSGKEQLAPVG